MNLLGKKNVFDLALSVLVSHHVNVENIVRFLHHESQGGKYDSECFCDDIKD